jgi:hypothetical protein
MTPAKPPARQATVITATFSDPRKIAPSWKYRTVS